MKITIDTKADSKEEINKIIQFLLTLDSTTDPEDNLPSGENVLGLFDTQNETPKEEISLKDLQTY